jgi:hypothetical protein
MLIIIIRSFFFFHRPGGRVESSPSIVAAERHGHKIKEKETRLDDGTIRRLRKEFSVDFSRTHKSRWKEEE